MTDYATLESRIRNRETIILDGAVGTQLQSMGVALTQTAWSSNALKDYPFTVQRMHENYIQAGVDVITTNSYPSARHNLYSLGLGDQTKELNLRSVMLAQDARDRCAKERPVYIAGSVSNYGLLVGSEPGWREYPYFKNRMETSVEQARANLREQAEILAEAGVDLLLSEATGSSEQRRWVTEACLSTGLPVWTGFKCRLGEQDGSLKVGYRSDEPLMESFESIAGLGGSVVAVFHSSIETTNAALPLVREKWSGPLCVYPEADRHDYVATYRDDTVPTRITPSDFVEQARAWVDQGVQIIGGCCGIEVEYIRPLREALPTHLPG